MKKNRSTEEQMVAILREADKVRVPEVAKKHEVSVQAIYTWRRRFGELQPADVRRLRQLEIENVKLKRFVAERDLEIDTTNEINRRKRSARRRAASRLRSRAIAVCRSGVLAG